MHINGYSEEDSLSENATLLSLSEVSFSVTSDELRKIAEFLIKASEDMDKWGLDFGHSHLSDFDSSFSHKKDIIVSNAIKE